MTAAALLVRTLVSDLICIDL